MMIPTAALDPIVYYNPEIHLFPALARSFSETGRLDPEALYLILDWKAPRARTRHLRRLVEIAGSFDAAARGIAADLGTAAGSEQRMHVLLTKWGFRLSTASAILTVLYPDTFTVYDTRVCETLGDFHQLDHRKGWSPDTWVGYERFIAAARAAAPSGLSLRDCDRWLWGKDKQRTMVAELTSVGQINAEA
jgi:hypothetical protein